MRKCARAIFGAATIVTVLLCAVTGFYYKTLPDNYYLSEKGTFNINTKLYISTEGLNSDGEALNATSQLNSIPDEMYSVAELKLFGLIPIKDVKIERISRPELVPCGTPFGIKIITDGAIVTGFGEIEDCESPAKTGGIKCGDIIYEVNGKKIGKNKDITEAVQTNPEKTEIKIKRDDEIVQITVTPVKSGGGGLLKIGVWVRDSSAGIGTMTFYHPETKVFGGLGHSVCDAETGKILPLSKGEAVSVAINSVIKGTQGDPGELCGTFLSKAPIGLIEHNTEVGIFGTMNYTPTLEDALPMAFKQEVKIGAATILSTLGGSEPKEYDIIIEKIDYNDKNNVKNMIIKIIDRELLSIAGGIVQGMSGSPIIQNGMLVGAVTHVFVNDTTRGYAIFAENMYRKSNEVMKGSVFEDAA